VVIIGFTWAMPAFEQKTTSKTKNIRIDPILGSPS